VTIVNGYRHNVASHCETGSVRNLLGHAGLDVSEPMVFGIGSGPAFYYLFFAKGPSGLPMLGIRLQPGKILSNFAKLCSIDFQFGKFDSTDRALREADALLEAGVPFAACVDMFYMKYLPSFLHVHAPFHFIVITGREGDEYLVSDPYYDDIVRLHVDDLRAAWETHAPLAKDNSLYRVKGIPAEIDWRRATRRAMTRTCRDMLPPPVVRDLLWFVGIRGMRTFARKMLGWTREHSGVKLREGILMTAVGFEDQGTGGGAFRLMYGAFLQEASRLFGSAGLEELAGRMVEHGRAWREVSRKLIRVGKTVPMDDDAFADWHAANATALQEGLAEISGDFLRAADFEEAFFRELAAVAGGLG